MVVADHLPGDQRAGPARQRLPPCVSGRDHLCRATGAAAYPLVIAVASLGFLAAFLKCRRRRRRLAVLREVFAHTHIQRDSVHRLFAVGQRSYPLRQCPPPRLPGPAQLLGRSVARLDRIPRLAVMVSGPVQEQAAAADRARISAERRMREAEQAQRLAEEREDNARADLERIGEKTCAEVLELGEKLGDAKKATELAEGVTADQANQLRALRTENRELQAARTALDDELAERGRQLQAAQHTGAQLRTQLSEHSDRAAALALQLATATADATAAREETLATHAGLERVRQRHDEQTQHLRAELEAARQQAEARATELIRVQTLHEADQDLLAELRGQREDLKARHNALHAEVGELRTEIDQLRTHPAPAAAEPEQDR